MSKTFFQEDLAPLVMDLFIPLRTYQNHSDNIFHIGLRALLVEMWCVGASIVISKLGVAIGLGFFQIRVRSFILYICQLATDA